MPETPKQPDTRARILASAERLFAEKGIIETSLRAIVADADVNIAAVNYHFGSKDALVVEVLGAHVGPINDARLARLDELESESDLPELEEILESFVRPTLEGIRDPERGPALLRLAGRIHSLNDPKHESMLSELFREVAHRYLAAIHAALPDLPAADRSWRFQFMLGTMIHTLSFPSRMVTAPAGEIRADDIDEILDHMIPFLAAGFRARVQGSPREETKR